MTVTATDLDSCALVLFGAGHDATTPLRAVLYASCALPVYFPAAVIDGRRLADGGLRAVLPLEPAKAIRADLVVAVHVGPGFDELPPPATRIPRFPPALIRVHGNSERILMAAQVERTIPIGPRALARLVVVRRCTSEDVRRRQHEAVSRLVTRRQKATGYRHVASAVMIRIHRCSGATR
jgi:predicted acylesterase/phospholipase RssA